MSIFKRKRRLTRVAKLPLVFGLMVFVALLVISHVEAAVNVKQVSVPVLSRLPNLQRQHASLTEQVEIAELQKAGQIGSQQEYVDTYVLPKELNNERVLAYVSSIIEVLQAEGLVGPEGAVTLSEEGTAITMEYPMHERAVEMLLNSLQLAGVMTVGDALTASERALLFAQVDKENPAGITVLEQFLQTQLLRYGRSTQAVQSRLQRSFTSAEFGSALQLIGQSNLLRLARDVFSTSVGVALEQQQLWPLPFVEIKEFTQRSGSSPGWYHVQSRLQIVERM